MNTLSHVLGKTAPLTSLCLSLALSGCGGGGIGSTASTSTVATNCANPGMQDPNGCVYVGITDAPGDFLTYTVNVSALTLTRADGVTVQMLPQSTSVDFAQYGNLTEFLSGVSMPPALPRPHSPWAVTTSIPISMWPQKWMLVLACPEELWMRPGAL